MEMNAKKNTLGDEDIAFVDFLFLMELLDSKQDERKKWPKLLDTPERLPIVLDNKEMQSILSVPDTATILGRRPRHSHFNLLCRVACKQGMLAYN
ncbi:hypothetical protein YDYSY3_08460 [Paenibacillus chitinolyticus]|nr:hypothetical protein YDYSY3_08460 [Paenibacillus chitinolyticus]